MNRFTIKVGDITKCKADAVVQPITEELKSAGAVSEEIFRTADDLLLQELAKAGTCPLGQVLVSEAHGLNVKKIIHTANPKWMSGQENEEQMLASCYENCLKKAVELGLKSIAFPSISTGTYHFPVNLAAKVAVSTILNFLKTDDTLEEVFLICLDERTTLVYDMCLMQCSR